MLNPPIPVISSAVGVRDHDLRWAIGQVVPVAVSTSGPVWVTISFACAGGAHGITHVLTGNGILHSASINTRPRSVIR